MPKMIYVNFPVKDLAASTRFYEAIGCVKNDQASGENHATMMWSDTIFFGLMSHEVYATFSPKPIADAQTASAALYALSFDSREAVDAITKAAGEAGGTADLHEPEDLGFMYSRAFADPDGNGFGPFWMNPAAQAQ